MPTISIGVPVYNEEKYLAQALEQLGAQTFSDIEILIFDNASSDRTGEIARGFAGRDARFKYVRQARNKGALPNFLDALEAATSPFFMWKAADDRIPPDFVEKLHAALAGDPSKDMAAPYISAHMLQTGAVEELAFPDLRGISFAGRQYRLLFGSHAAWIYGLFRREPLLQRTRLVFAEYGHEWAFDHLTLLPFLLDDRVAFAGEARFEQVIKPPRAAEPGAKKQKVVRGLRLMSRLRARFLRVARRDVAERSVPVWQRPAFRAMLFAYTGKRVFPWRRIMRLRFRHYVLRRPEVGPL